MSSMAQAAGLASVMRPSAGAEEDAVGAVREEDPVGGEADCVCVLSHHGVSFLRAVLDSHPERTAWRPRIPRDPAWNAVLAPAAL